MRYFTDERLNNLALEIRRFAEEQAVIENTEFWKILRNKTVISICEKMPKSIEEFITKKVLIGKSKIEKYGDSIIKIVLKYCEDTVSKLEIANKNNYVQEKSSTVKYELVERAKVYLKLLGEGIHPVTGIEIPHDSTFLDEKIKNCFNFITQVLDEYVELSEKVKKLESSDKIVVVPNKQAFSITQEQCYEIKLSKEPLSIISFMKNINSVINAETTEKLTSTRVTKWLVNKGLVTSTKVQAVVKKTTYKPSELALKIGILEEETIDKKSGEIKAQIKLEESAQLFIIENIEEIILTT